MSEPRVVPAARPVARAFARPVARAAVGMMVGITALGLLLAACAPNRTAPVDAPSSTAMLTDVASFAVEHGFEALELGTVRIEGADRSMSVDVVVAADDDARARGLQGVTSLPDGVGMLFVLPDPPGPDGPPGFWMLGTPIPLDIAFVRDGTVVAVATMTPCPVRPCPITHPEVPYDMALEVAAGALRSAGVGPGDRFLRGPLGGAAPEDGPVVR